jgi:hypothetical protein
MSRRSQVIQQRKAFENVPIIGRQAPAAPVDLNQLSRLLIEQGAPRRYMIQTSLNPSVVRLVAACGPLEIPLDLSPAEARRLASAIEGAAFVVDPVSPHFVEEEPPVPVSAEAEELLQEYIAAAAKDPNALLFITEEAETTPDVFDAIDLLEPSRVHSVSTTTCTSCFREVIDAPIEEPAEAFA